MTDELKAAVERAGRKAGYAAYMGPQEEPYDYKLLRALADEPVVLGYLAQAPSNTEVYVADIRDILHRLAEIVK